MTLHHQRISRGGNQVVTKLDDLPILAVIHPEFFEPEAARPEHLEPPGLHPIEHIHKPSLNAVAAIFERRPLAQHIEPLVSILFRQVFTGRSVVVAVMRPRPREPVTPRLQRRSVDDRCLLAFAIFLRQVNYVCISVPCEACTSAWMIPPKIKPADLNPMLWYFERLDCDAIFRDRKYPARPERWNSLGSRFAFMRRIAGNDLFALFRSVVFSVINRHRRDVTCLGAEILDRGHDKTKHNGRHAKQWRKGHD